MNKISEGYHFHALIAVDKEPHASWYKKGVHMHLQKVGYKPPEGAPQATIPIPPLTENELSEYLSVIDKKEEKSEEVVSHTLAKAYEKIVKMDKRERHVKRVISYMEKEIEGVPKQYEDYILFVGGKNTRIMDPPCASEAGTIPASPHRAGESPELA